MSYQRSMVLLILAMMTAQCGSKDDKTNKGSGDQPTKRSQLPTPTPSPEGETITDRIPIGLGGNGDSTPPRSSPQPTSAPTPLPTASPGPSPSPTTPPNPGVQLSGACSITVTATEITQDVCIRVSNTSDTTIAQQCLDAEGVFTPDAFCSEQNLMGICSNNQTSDGIDQYFYRTGDAQIDSQLRESNKANCNEPFVWQDPS